jgi:hypothetical protein
VIFPHLALQVWFCAKAGLNNECVQQNNNERRIDAGENGELDSCI